MSCKPNQIIHIVTVYDGIRRDVVFHRQQEEVKLDIKLKFDPSGVLKGQLRERSSEGRSALSELNSVD